MKQLYGFDEINKEILNSFYKNKLHHCNIFIGNQGNGKFEFAKQLAALILSEKNERTDIKEEDIEKNYNLINNQTHSDCIIFNTQSFLNEKKLKDKKTNNINIDQVRELLQFMLLTPILSKNKVIIINSIDLINYNGQNALLKSLEEPTNNTYILIICNNKEVVLKTIFSRCNIININNLSFENWCKILLDNLESSEIEHFIEDDFEKIYLLSNQSVNLAIEIIQNNTLNLYEQILKLFVNKDVIAIQKFSEEIDKNKQLYKLFVTILNNIMNDLIKYYLMKVENKFTQNYKDLFNKIIHSDSMENLITQIDKINKILSSADLYSLSVKHCLNVIFNNYL